METAHKIRTRVRLVEAAREMFGTRGYSATTHADLAAGAGIGRTTFYEYFESKEDLLVHLVDTAIPELNDELFRGLEQLGPYEQLSVLVVRMIEFVGTDTLGLILHTEVPRLPDEVQRRMSAAHDPLSKRFVSIYNSGVAAGVFVPMDPMLAARLIYESIMTAGRVLKATRDPKQHVHRIAEAAAGFVMRGFAAV
ncbi:MAG: TetR/AcrR family transcriptional regulator [Acidimicrobiia bacterium]|nr:TetR/AcrR family transcriptional regulator [Acidimicrobiia bacterium]